MAKRLILPLIAVLMLTVGLAACGSDDDADTASTTQSTPAVTSATGDATAAATPAAAAAAATAAATSAASDAAPAGVQPVSVKAGEYFYDPKDLRVRPGAVAVTMTNDGPDRPHTFAVKNKSGDGDLFKSDQVPVGEPVTLEFTVMEEGTYEVYCSLPGHAARGQRGTLTVSRT